MMSNTRRFLGILALFLGAVPAVASAEDVDAQVAEISQADPLLSTGPLYATAVQRPESDMERLPACSFRYPVCVHARRGVAAGDVLSTLAALERASSSLVQAMGLPAPLGDGSRGGTPAFDLYLVPPAAMGPAGTWVTTARDDPDPGPYDRASAFALLREDTPAGCIRSNLVARALASAIAWGVDAGDDPAARESSAAYLAELAAPCGAVTADLVDDFQAHPERSVCASSPTVGPAAAMALPWYLDVTFGTGAPGRVPVALAVIASQRTPAGNLRWQNEPDLLDAMRGMLKGRTPAISIADLWIDFAIARLFSGARDDGVHFPETAFLGSFGRVRFDWSFPYASLPRRVSPERPIDPVGSTYIWIDLRGAPQGARLAFRMEWEPPVLFRWVLVRVGENGGEVSRVHIAPQQKSTSAEKNLDALDGLAGVALIGVNIGDLALDDPFDPDQAPYEPHSYVVTVAATR